MVARWRLTEGARITIHRSECGGSRAGWPANWRMRGQALSGSALTQEGARRQHFAVLTSLAEQGGASQADLGRRFSIDRSDLHALLGEMECNGLVARVRRRGPPQRRHAYARGGGRTRAPRRTGRLRAASSARTALGRGAAQLIRLLERVVRGAVLGSSLCLLPTRGVRLALPPHRRRGRSGSSPQSWRFGTTRPDSMGGTSESPPAASNSPLGGASGSRFWVRSAHDFDPRDRAGGLERPARGVGGSPTSAFLSSYDALRLSAYKSARPGQELSGGRQIGRSTTSFRMKQIGGFAGKNPGSCGLQWPVDGLLHSHETVINNAGLRMNILSNRSS